MGSRQRSTTNSEPGRTPRRNMSKPQQAEATVATVARRAPWAFIGYDANRFKQWQKSRATLIEQVDARRAT